MASDKLNVRLNLLMHLEVKLFMGHGSVHGVKSCVYSGTRTTKNHSIRQAFLFLPRPAILAVHQNLGESRLKVRVVTKDGKDVFGIETPSQCHQKLNRWRLQGLCVL